LPLAAVLFRPIRPFS
jgi:integration host factor subunit beta